MTVNNEPESSERGNLQALEAKVSRLEAELMDIRAVLASSRDSSEMRGADGADRRISRAGMLKGVAAGAVGVAIAGMASAGGASAAGMSSAVGANASHDIDMQSNYQATGAEGTSSSPSGVGFQTGLNSYFENGIEVTGASIGVSGTSTDRNSSGVYGYSAADNAYGVTGEASGDGGVGVEGLSTGSSGAGVVGAAGGINPNLPSGQMFGVYGDGHTGVGVFGISAGNDGVEGSASYNGKWGVRGTGSGKGGGGVVGVGPTGVAGLTLGTSQTNLGLWGGSLGGKGIGVLGSMAGNPPKVDQPVGVYGDGVTGKGGVFTGESAQLCLVPATTAGRPTSGVHVKGDIFLDKKCELFVCTKAGTPGTWTAIVTKAVPK